MMKTLPKPIASVISLLLAFVLCAANLSTQSLAAASDLDLAFGVNGKVTTNIFSDYNSATAVAIQPDGKILVAGLASDGPLQNEFALVRYQPNGSLDPNFGAGGKVTTNFANESAGGNAIALQADGSIIVAGTVTHTQGDSDFALVRYLPDGTPDPGFGTGGIVVTDFGGNSNAFAQAVALQANGKIVVAGFTAANPSAPFDFALARYNTNGNLDPNFGAGGKVTTAFIAGASETIATVAIQADNKIVVAGSITLSNSTDFALARYNPNGSLDGGFGSGGKVFTDFSGNNDAATALALQSDGRILVGGLTFGGPLVQDFALARYNTNGSLDSMFGSGGKVLTDFYGQGDSLTGIAIQADGFIVAAGNSYNGAAADFALARYSPSGGPDAGFGSGGRTSTDFFNSADGATGVALQADGKIVAVGGASATGSNSQSDFALARYNGGAGLMFDRSVQDESSDNLFLFNSTTGEYQFKQCGSGLVLGGQGSITVKGCMITLQHNTADRRVLVKFDTCAETATASVQLLTTGMNFSIADKNTANNTFACP